MVLVNKSTLWLTTVVLLCVACNRTTTFEQLSASTTNIDFVNQPLKKKAFGILYYLYYYNGGGVAVGDVNNDGLQDIYFTANTIGGNKLYLNKGNFKFEDVTEKAGVQGNSDWCSGVTMADVNGDGYLDIYVSAVANHHGLEGHNELFINNKNGTFTESAAQYGLNFSGFTTQAAFFDYDHDGDLDCYILNQSHKPNQNIVDTSNRRRFDQFSGDRLYRNDLNTAAKKFTDVSAAAGIYQSSLGYGLGLAVADFNNDGWEDVYVGNDFHENDYYYVNNGNGTFTESGAKHFNHYSRFSMGNDVADYNNDGNLDLITVDMLPDKEKVLKSYGSDENPEIYKYKLKSHGFQYQYSKNCLQMNNGDGSSFSETSLLSGVSATDWSWSPLFADFDNDGNNDLLISSGIVKRPVDLDYVRFISNMYNHKALNSTDKYDDQALEKMPDGSSHPFLFRGDGKMNFTDVSDKWGIGKMKGYFTGAAYADLDNDGRIDIIINALGSPAVILKNIAEPKKYLSLSFKGDGSNTFGIGAKAYVFQQGKTQYKQLMLTRGFQSSSEPRLHFGLGDSSTVDSVLVVWPNQTFQLIKGNLTGNNMVVNQKDASGVFDHEKFFKRPDTLFKKDDAIKIDWSHHENAFNDFDIQYLIPHSLSTRGPKLAIADINGDGLEDMYACAAKGQGKGVLMQQKNGSFVKSDTASFADDVLCEDVDAKFVDVNGDKFLDLYIVSGGNEYPDGAPQLKDRIYINDGKGHFKKDEAALPDILKNKSCVAIADVDNDGDADVFTGGLANAKAYGIPQTSYLLLNDGKGRFSIAPNDVISLTNAGMITSAVFADVNNDKRPDLVMVGEWSPLQLYINRNGKFERTLMGGTEGMWQTVFADDVNGDGHVDLLAGNWGWNNKFYSGKNGPVQLYVSDFDHNGQTDQLLSYTVNGVEFPFLAKDEVERPLPTLKKHYLRYDEYSGVPMKDVFYGWIDTIKPLQCNKLSSALFVNNGNGRFNMIDLPEQLQMAPVFAFQKIVDSTREQNLYLCGGNFFDVIPYEGRYDAQPLAFFSVDKNNRITCMPQQNLLAVQGQIRDIQQLKTATNKNLLVAAPNNDSLIFLDYKGAQSR